ncbi:MAG TPA: amylo-alpha-1,6-glucosidase [Thermaerobacter sp.]
MPVRVIKEDDLFLLTDERGDIPAGHRGGMGLYRRDTRFLSRFELRVNGEPPVVLQSEADRNYAARILLMNPPETGGGPHGLARDSIILERERAIYQGVLYERLTVTNHHRSDQVVEVTYHFDADFADMFIVRGFRGARTGSVVGRVCDDRGLCIRYRGADGLERETRVRFSEPATGWDDGHRFLFRLEPGQSRQVTLTVEPVIAGVPAGGPVAPGSGKATGSGAETGTAAGAATVTETATGAGTEAGPQPARPVAGPPAAPAGRSLDEVLGELERSYREWQDTAPGVESSHDVLNHLLQRSLADLRMLTTDLGDGPFPVAGVPWFAVPFGRDSLITALQALPFRPELARGTLRTLARLQGTRVDPWREEEPGKIPHEVRYGELANTHQIPFGRYYGTVDATPLFLILAAEFYRWTGDRPFAASLRPHVLAALEWIERYGDSDGDGFVEYRGKSDGGLANQGWKDSGDSVIHRDGTLARGPIALCEVQGYVYEAMRQWGRIFREWGDVERAARLDEAAARLKQRFAEAFWMEDEGFVALALDGEKRRVATLTSNPGHLLITDLLDRERADRVARRLLEPDFFSGYGIRTMSARERAYNPISYHNGSVWPHDNSLIAWGMARHGHHEAVHRVLAGILAVAEQAEYHRLPELWCGFPAAPGRRFVPYPVACSPQAWAAGAPLLLLRALLGLEPDLPGGVIRLRPALPAWLDGLRVLGLRLGNGRLSFEVRRDPRHASEAGETAAGREGRGTTVEILENTTGARLVVG